MTEQTNAQRLAEIRERWAAAQAGPWHWDGNGTSHDIRLQTIGRGGIFVMCFARWGMQGAQPEFNSGYGMRKGVEFMVRPESWNPWKITGIDHPDAVAIAHSWEDVSWLLSELEARDREIAVLRDTLECLDPTTLEAQVEYLTSNRNHFWQRYGEQKARWEALKAWLTGKVITGLDPGYYADVRDQMDRLERES